MDNNEIYERLKKIVNPNNVMINEDMKKHTSFKIGGSADFFIKAENVEEIKAVLQFAKETKLPLTIMGNGSNLLIKDKGIKGIVLKVDLKNIQIQTSQEKEFIYKQVNNVAEEKVSYTNQALVVAGAGVPLGLLAHKLLAQSISGFEFASGIPGTIGGAILMNAGAFGKEFKDIVVKTKYIDMEGNVHVINNEQHEFEYRNSVFSKKNYIVLETTLALEWCENNKLITDKMEEFAIQRKENQPNEPSAGSTFKRGKDYITAKLIDECGLKGFSIGDAQVSEKHAGFIINKGNATAKDVLELIDYIKLKVKEKYDKDIELEIEVIGE